MRRLFIAFVLLVFVAGLGIAKAAQPTPFPVAPHKDVTIEWWYLNTNLQTKSGRHLAVICSFFRFGNLHGTVAKDSSIKVAQSHYLIYAITDIDRKKHYAFSFGDKNTLSLLQDAATLGLEANPESTRLQQLVATLSTGNFPPPTRLIPDACSVTSTPFRANYGPANSVVAIPGENNTFRLHLASGATAVSLTFTGLKSPMLVNGDGNTGLRERTDMKYVSLTRCKVTGTIDVGSGPEEATGDGWFDHQWGNSWTTQSAGWDWFGVRLQNGTDILFFRQLDLKTGLSFFPCATFELANGDQRTTHNITFSYDPSLLWSSDNTHVTYPLTWTINFPDQQTTLTITPEMLDQEMPVLAGGGAIWEGACSVSATVNGALVPGVAYMELVGYNSRAVRATLVPSNNAK